MTTRDEETEWFAGWVQRNPLWFLLGSAAVAAMLLAAWGAWGGCLSGSDDWSTRGAFGDSFGPMVGFVTALALAAAVLSTFLQREELRLQRQELRLATNEAQHQTEATKELAAATKTSADAATVANEVATLQLAASERMREAYLRAVLATIRSNILRLEEMTNTAKDAGIAAVGGGGKWSEAVSRHKREPHRGGTGAMLAARYIHLESELKETRGRLRETEAVSHSRETDN